MTKLLVTLFILFTSFSSYAEYVATGKIKGNVCHGFVIEVCGLHDLAAVKGDKGQLFEIKRSFDSVDEFQNGTCFIQTKRTGGGLYNLGMNAIMQPTFLERDQSGSYIELDVDYVVFPCIRR